MVTAGQYEVERHYPLNETSRITGLTVPALRKMAATGRLEVVRLVGARRLVVPEREVRRLVGVS